MLFWVQFVLIYKMVPSIQQQNWIINKTLYLSLPKYVGNQIINFWFWYDSEEIPRRLQQLQRTVGGKPLCSQHNFRIVSKTSCGRQNGEGLYLRCGQSRRNLFQKRPCHRRKQIEAIQDEIYSKSARSAGEPIQDKHVPVQGRAARFSTAAITVGNSGEKVVPKSSRKIEETKFRIGLQPSTEHFHRIVNHLSAFTFLCPAADPE